MVTKNSAPSPVVAPAPAKKKEQVAERRKRRDTRRSVRVEDNNEAQNKVAVAVQETQADIIEQPETVIPNNVVSKTTINNEQEIAETAHVDIAAEIISQAAGDQAVSETDKDEGSTTRTRSSRRSPRHIRAAGQKRRKEVDEKDETLKTEVTEITQEELQIDEPVAALVETAPVVSVSEEKLEQPAVEITTKSAQDVNSSETTTQPVNTKENDVAVAEPVNTKENDVAVAEPVNTKEDDVVAAEPVNTKEDDVAAAEPKEDVSKLVKKESAKKMPKKATSLKVVTKPVKKGSVSAPMARPTPIDDTFIDIKIGSLNDAARPEVKRSGKSAALLSSSNTATAPATRPGSQSQ
jgi:ribonuclease E